MQFMDKLRRVFNSPFFLIWIAPFLLFSPVLFAGKALFWGTPALQFVPWWKWAFDTLLSGHLPLWNPLLGMGAPLVANYQSALFYPPNWVYFLFYVTSGIAGLAWSQALMAALHLAWSGMGMALLARRLGLGRLAQTVSGLAFGLSGYLVARAWFASINTAAAWLPWVLLLAYDLAANLDGKRISNILKLGVVIGLQLLAGHAQTSWYTLLLAVLWVGFWAWRNSNPAEKFSRLRSALRGWIGLGLAVLLAVGIAAVQLLPTAEYLIQSQRASEVDFEAAMTYSFWPWRFLGLLAPDLFGSPVTGDYWGYANYWEDAVYIGLLPFLLGAGVLSRGLFAPKELAGDRRQETDPLTGRPLPFPFSPFARFSFFLILASFLLALGKNTPIFPWLYRHIPTFDMFNSPTRFSVWAVTALALLAGFGVEIWRRPVKRGLYWTRLATAGAFAVSLGAGLGWLLLRDSASDFHSSFVRSAALAGFWGLGAGVLSLLAPERDADQPPAAYWSWGVLLWVAADLLVAGWGLNPGIRLDFYTRQSSTQAQLHEMAGDGRLYLLVGDEYKIKYDQYFLFESFDPGKDWFNLRAILLPNLNMLENFPSANNYDPLVPGRYARWMEAIQLAQSPLREDWLDLMGISLLEMEAPDANLGVVFGSRDTAARVRWVPCARFAAGQESAWDLVSSGWVDFEADVILEGAGHSQSQDCESRKGVAQILSENPGQIILQTEAETPGWLVLSDVGYPGWRARLDGQAVQALNADYLFRAVGVPAGTHTIEFVYRPAWFYGGVILSLIAWAGLAGYAFWIRRK